MNVKKSAIEKFGVFDEDGNLDKTATIAAIIVACDKYIKEREIVIRAEKTLLADAVDCLFKMSKTEYISQDNIVSMVVAATINTHANLFTDSDFPNLKKLTIAILKSRIAKGEMVQRAGLGIAMAK